ncbi:MAG: hypothetical protein AAGA66_00915 [Bacteroidota bacterium]
MKTFLFILVRFSMTFFSDPSAVLKSEVRLVDGRSVCEVTYSFPEEGNDYRLRYKTEGQAQWTTRTLTRSGHLRLTSLRAPATYLSQLTWTDADGNPQESVMHTFLTHQLLTNGTSAYENYKLINSGADDWGLVYALYQPGISFRYEDKYRQDGHLLGTVQDAAGQLVARFAVATSATGTYHLDLLDLPVDWVLDAPYQMDLSDGRNANRTVNFRLSHLNETLSAQINSLPLYLDCEAEAKSTIQYLSGLLGGNAPYELSWTVTDLDLVNLLYGPEKTTLRGNEEVSSITVDHTLPYVVTLSVFDECGRFTEQSLIVTCNDDDTEDALFFEPLDGPSGTSPATNAHELNGGGTQP